jgi:hypothetical protein
MDLKKSEEAKRNKAIDPVARWKQIQDMITWAEANLPSHQRRNRPRISKKSQIP